jgi:hypothetical protein
MYNDILSWSTDIDWTARVKHAWLDIYLHHLCITLYPLSDSTGTLGQYTLARALTTCNEKNDVAVNQSAEIDQAYN